MDMLRSVHIEGFKSIRDAAVSFGPITVLIGANGAGKSNLIAFFRMLGFSTTGALQEFVARAGGASGLLHFGPRNTQQVRGEFEFETGVGLNKYSMQLAYAAGDSLIFTDEQVQFSKHDWPGTGPVVSLGAGHRESLLGSAADAGDKTAIVAFNTICRWKTYQFHDTSVEAKIRQSTYIGDNHYLRADAGNLAAYLYMLRETERPYYDRIVSTFRMAAPFFDDFVSEPLELNRDRIQLDWRERGHDVLFGPHQLSDGSLRTIALLTLLLQPENRLPSVMIIDEPELGLHPFVVTLLGSLVHAVSSSCQVILATQSTAVVDQFGADDIVVVERTDRGETEFKTLDDKQLAGWLEDYSLGELWLKNVIGGRP